MTDRPPRWGINPVVTPTGETINPRQPGYTRHFNEQERAGALAKPKFYGRDTSVDNRDAMARTFAEYGYDPHIQRANTSNLFANGMKLRANRQFEQAPEPNIGPFIAGATDPFNIPSSAVGLANPAFRDAWRGVQEQNPVAAAAGSIASFGGAGLMLGGARAGLSAAASAAAPYTGDIADYLSKRLHPNYKPPKTAGDADE